MIDWLQSKWAAILKPPSTHKKLDACSILERGSVHEDLIQLHMLQVCALNNVLCLTIFYFANLKKHIYVSFV